MGKLFGTDGVRGVANEELTNELAYQLGRFGAHVITGGKKGSTIIIGKDTRVSGDMLESSLISGILSAGCDVIKVGVLPTPAIPKLIKHFKADAGVMISASHNPVEFNGIKFFNKEGYKLTDAIEEEIEDYILNHKDLDHNPSGTEIGRKTEIFKAMEIYAEEVMETIEGDLSGLKVAIDAANGAAFEVAKYALDKLGAKTFVINNAPDGFNINENCGSTHPEGLCDYVKNHDVDLGLAFDGDADRVLAVDENGVLIDGDKIMVICGKFLASQGQLNNNTVVSTVMSNLGLDIALKENNIQAVKTKVGDRYVLEAMKEGHYALGGEQSGHIIFLNYNTTGDGLLTGVQLMNVIKQTGQSLSDLGSAMDTYPQILLNAKVANNKKHGYLDNATIKEAIKEVEAFYDGAGRVLIRPSGTEPLVRVMIEGKDQSQLQGHAEQLVSLIEKELG
jgi:phosphoglucosamine mutase